MITCCCLSVFIYPTEEPDRKTKEELFHEDKLNYISIQKYFGDHFRAFSLDNIKLLQCDFYFFIFFFFIDAPGIGIAENFLSCLFSVIKYVPHSDFLI